MNTHTQTVVTIGLVLLIVAALSAGAPARAGSRGHCTTAILEEPFQTPDGSLHAAGKVTLCESGIFSPVASLHSIFVNGLPVAMSLSRRGQAEDGTDQGAFVMLTRDVAGLLHLAGYARPSGGRLVTYELQTSPRARARQVAVQWATLPPIAVEETGILLAKAD